MSPRFEPVARRTVAEEIREQLLESIGVGSLNPGDRVPSERDLCSQFGVARTSVREAIQGLVSVGVIERRGNRSYVAELLPQVDQLDARKAGVRQIFEVRRVIELPVFELAAERATPDARAEVAELATLFMSSMGLEDFRALDRRFHGAIAAACGNPLLSELHGKVLDSLFASEDFESLLGADVNRDEVSDLIELSSRGHCEIASAIAAGDPVRTVAATAHHLDEVEQHMVDRLV